MAGHEYPGHTEMLAHLSGAPEVSMMLTAPKLRVIHVTTHIGLIDAIAKIEPGLVERVIARGRAVLVKDAWNSRLTWPRRCAPIYRPPSRSCSASPAWIGERILTITRMAGQSRTASFSRAN